MAKISKTKRASVIKDLKSDNEILAFAAIERLKTGGDASYISEILNALSDTTEVGIESAITQLLFDLKDKLAIEEMVNQFENEDFKEIRVLMLSACWHTGVDLSHRLHDFITVACTGSYMECLEVLTVIENWETITDQEGLENETLRLKAYLSESDVPENDELIFSIVEEMEKFVAQ